MERRRKKKRKQRIYFCLRLQGDDDDNDDVVDYDVVVVVAVVVVDVVVVDVDVVVLAFSRVEMRASADERALLIKERSASLLFIRTREDESFDLVEESSVKFTMETKPP